MFKHPVMNKDILCCPQCGEDYLHQESVHVWFRDHEDAKHGVHTITATNIVKVDSINDQSENPSRRDALYILFSCEFCEGSVFKLWIEQHKGSTYFRWEF